MTRVLHYHHDWLPASEPFVWDLIRHLPGPSVVLSGRGAANVDRFPVPRLEQLSSIVDRWPDEALDAGRQQQIVTAWLTARCIRHRIRLIHAHHGYGLSRIAGAARRRRLPVVVSLHGHDVFGYVDEQPDVYAGVLEHIDAVIVPSEFLVDRVVELGADPERVHVIGSGIDTTFFSPTPLPVGREVLFVGRFVEKKGLDVLAQAWPAVVEAVPDARLRVLGFGPLDHLARDVGAVVEESPDRQRVRDAMRAARVVVSPSRTATDDVAETLLMVNLEAQASGRPVVTTDHGGIPEYVRAEETALVVPEADHRALADALVRVLSDDELAQRLGEAGPAFAARQDVRAVAARVHAVHTDVLGRARSSPPQRARRA